MYYKHYIQTQKIHIHFFFMVERYSFSIFWCLVHPGEVSLSPCRKFSDCAFSDVVLGPGKALGTDLPCSLHGSFALVGAPPGTSGSKFQIQAAGDIRLRIQVFS